MSVKCLSVPSVLAVLMMCSAQAALVAHWDLEEGTGATTSDQVSTTAGALGTGVSWSTDTPGAASDYSLSFPNTTAGFVGTTLNATDMGISGTGAKTILGWFKTTSQEQQMFFGYSPSNGTGAGQDLRLGHDASGYLRFEVSSGFALYNGKTLDDGAWHMAAVIISADDTTSTVDFYLDGDLLTPTSSSTRAINTLGASSLGANFDQVVLGNGNPTSSTQAWDGFIDEVRVYNTALTETELDSIYAAIPEPATFGLVGLMGLACLVRRRIRG